MLLITLKKDAGCALIFDLELLTGFEAAPAKNSPPDCFLNASRFVLTKEQSRNTAKEKLAYISAQSVCYKSQYIV